MTKQRHRRPLGESHAITPAHVAGVRRSTTATIVGRTAVQDDLALDDAITLCHDAVRTLLDQQRGGALDAEHVSALAKTVDALVKATRERRRREEKAAEDLARLPDEELERLAGVTSEEGE